MGFLLTQIGTSDIAGPKGGASKINTDFLNIFFDHEIDPATFEVFVGPMVQKVELCLR